MITIKHPVDLPDTYPLDRIGPLKDLLFFDIETTGFSGDTSQLYLIGCTYHDGFGWRLIQWFADSRESEREPVSYTHLDVYKRQGLGAASPVSASAANKAAHKTLS